MVDLLVIDDEQDIGELIKDIIEDELNLQTEYTLNSSSAIKLLEKFTPKIVILDVWLEGSDMDGLGLLKIIKEKYKNTAVIIISGHGNIETSIKAIKLGAYSFIDKPFKSEKLILTVKRTLENIELQQYNTQLKQQNDLAAIIGKSKKINDIKNTIANKIGTNTRTMIIGEIGTGKEKIARLVHDCQNSGNKPFYKINIENYTEQELDKILFGYKNDTPIFEKAKRSTLYLNQVTKLTSNLQKKLLNYLNKSQNSIQFCRIISSSSLIKNKLKKIFNHDLLQRLSSITIEIPPLRERKQDIQSIVEYYVNNFKSNYNINNINIDDDFFSQFLNYDWPGNILELKASIENILIKLLLKSHTSLNIKNSLHKSTENFDTEFYHNQSFKVAKQFFEKKYIEINLQKNYKNVTKTAKKIGIERTALHKKIKDLGINFHN